MNFDITTFHQMEFTLFNNDWKVRWRSASEMEDAEGLCVFSEQTIYLSTELLGSEESHIWLVLAHEVTHAVLYYAGPDITENEVMVELISGLVCQLFKTLKIY